MKGSSARSLHYYQIIFTIARFLSIKGKEHLPKSFNFEIKLTFCMEVGILPITLLKYSYIAANDASASKMHF